MKFSRRNGIRSTDSLCIIQQIRQILFRQVAIPNPIKPPPSKFSASSLTRNQISENVAALHLEEGEVIGEMRRGYLLGDRLLRPAMVKVAKA